MALTENKLSSQSKAFVTAKGQTERFTLRSIQVLHEPMITLYFIFTITLMLGLMTNLLSKGFFTLLFLFACFFRPLCCFFVLMTLFLERRKPVAKRGHSLEQRPPRQLRINPNLCYGGSIWTFIFLSQFATTKKREQKEVICRPPLTS